MNEQAEQLEEFSSIDEMGMEEETGGDVTPEEPTFTIPKKFEGKSQEDIVTSYIELEKELGRKNNEVGELRKMTDQFLQLELSQKGQSVQQNTESESKPKVDLDNLLDNPEAAISALVENNPKLKTLEQQLQQAKINESRQAFEQKHSDWADVVGSKDFQDWVQASPARLRLFQEADQNYDYVMGAELLDTYKALHGHGDTPEAKEQRQQQLKKASVEKGSGQTGGRKKVFRRSDLLNLMMTNRDKYNSMLPEIEKAYAEGRVR